MKFLRSITLTLLALGLMATTAPYPISLHILKPPKDKKPLTFLIGDLHIDTQGFTFSEKELHNLLFAAQVPFDLIWEFTEEQSQRLLQSNDGVENFSLINYIKLPISGIHVLGELFIKYSQFSHEGYMNFHSSDPRKNISKEFKLYSISDFSKLSEAFYKDQENLASKIIKSGNNLLIELFENWCNTIQSKLSLISNNPDAVMEKWPQIEKDLIAEFPDYGFLCDILAAQNVIIMYAGDAHVNRVSKLLTTVFNYTPIESIRSKETLNAFVGFELREVAAPLPKNLIHQMLMPHLVPGGNTPLSFLPSDLWDIFNQFKRNWLPRTLPSSSGPAPSSSDTQPAQLTRSNDSKAPTPQEPLPSAHTKHARDEDEDDKAHPAKRQREK